jgi:hypothetical protein
MFGRRGQIHIIHDDREAFASRLQRYRFNLNHLTLPEIKDFNALGDRFCFKEKAKRCYIKTGPPEVARPVSWSG